MKTDILKLRKFAALLAAGFASCILNANVVDFEDVDIVTDPGATSGQGEALRFAFESGDNYWTSGEATFILNEGMSGSWSGITASKSTKTEFTGLSDQYSSVTGGGYDGSSQYGIAFYSSWSGGTTDILMGDLVNFSSMYITNTTYAYNSLINGDGYAKRLQDYADESQYAELKITIKGIDSQGEYTANSVEVILGNTYLNEDTGNWEVYILEDWKLVDLTTLNETDGLYGLNFVVEGTDKSYGWDNWPLYFAMDNISYTAVPEPAAFAMIFGALAIALAARKRR